MGVAAREALATTKMPAEARGSLSLWRAIKDAAAARKRPEDDFAGAAKLFIMQQRQDQDRAKLLDAFNAVRNGTKPDRRLPPWAEGVL